MMWAFLGKVALNSVAQLAQTKKGRKVIAGVVVAALIVPVASMVMAASMIQQIVGGAQRTQIQAAEEEEACFTSEPTGEQQQLTWAELDAEQQENATTIAGVVKSAVVVPGGADDATQQRAAVIAIATAMQESKLRNLTGGDLDSQGLFQQRPSQGWGSVEQITTPVHATTAFLYGATTNPGLVDVVSWKSYPLTAVAQAVQRSGYPLAYAKWETFANDVVDNVWATAQMTGVAPEIDRPDLVDTTATLRKVSLSVSAGGGEACGLVNDYTPTAWDGVYKKAQPWGGYTNGRVPLEAMCRIPWALAQMARCDAVDALVALDALWQTDHGGAHIPITDSYRDYDSQVAVKRKKGNLAATPGTSNHGWGLALDLSGFGAVGYYEAPSYLWMMQHGLAFGWVNPPFMQQGGSGPLEPWHWEFMGTPDPSTLAAVGVEAGEAVS